MSLPEDDKNKVDFAVEVIRSIGEHIQSTTNIKDELIPDMANTIFLYLYK